MKATAFFLLAISLLLWLYQASFSALPYSAAEAPAPVEATVTLTPDEALALRLVNTERTERGLKPLDFDPLLTLVARLHSQDMAKCNYFSHFEPATNHNPVDRYAELLGRRPNGVVGENIACCTDPLPGVMHQHLMDSPDHEANILDLEYTRLGVGVYMTPDGHTWLTQMFAGDWRQVR